jgi:hypothetical protein
MKIIVFSRFIQKKYQVKMVIYILKSKGKIDFLPKNIVEVAV